MSKQVVWHEMDECCKKAIAQGLLSCPVCKQVFMEFGPNVKTDTTTK